MKKSPILMNNPSPNNDDILRRLLKETESQGKMAKYSTLFLFGVIAYLLFVALGTFGKITQDTEKPIDWYDVTLCVRRGDIDKALEHANKLLENTPRDFEGHYRKGEILLILGDKAGARESFQSAYDIFPVYKYRHAVEVLE